jgi:hypothetical protein
MAVSESSSKLPFVIPIEFDVKTGFSIPENSRAPLGSNVKFELTDVDVTRSSTAFRQGAEFELFFEDDSPFDWRTASTEVRYPLPPSGGLALRYQPITEVLAQGEAKKKGKFKYGVRAKDRVSKRTTYDVDPYLEIF